MNPSVTPSMPLASLLSAPPSLSVPSSSKCTTYIAGVLVGWLPFSFHRGKKLITLGLVYCQQSGYGMVPLPLPSQLPLLPGDNQSMSFHWCWPSDRLPLL